jgi:hypothetical protein
VVLVGIARPAPAGNRRGTPTRHVGSVTLILAKIEAGVTDGVARPAAARSIDQRKAGDLKRVRVVYDTSRALDDVGLTGMPFRTRVVTLQQEAQESGSLGAPRS